jgi:hypothetical protein
VGRSRLLFFVRREVVPAFGVGGLRLSDRFGLTALIPMGRTIELDLNASHIMRSVPEGSAGDRATSDEGALALRWSLGRRAAIAAEARYRRRGPDGALPAIESAQGGIVVSFTSPRVLGR